MARYFAFLRAVNVGRGRTVKMDDLRRIFESLGFSRVATFIASGNVAFDTKAADGAPLERKIEAGLKKALGFAVDTFVRKAGELAAITDFKPFPQSKLEAAAEIDVIFLKSRIAAAAAAKVAGLGTETDEFRVHGREIYWLRRRKAPGLYSTVALEKALKAPFTARNARTIREIVAKEAPASRPERRNSHA